MSYGNFPARIWAIKFAAGTTALGSYAPSAALRLRHLRPVIVKKGTRAGSERCRVKVFPTAAMVTAMYTSDWVTIASIEAEIGAAAADSWYAHVRFDFGSVHLVAGTAYYAAIEFENYTPSASFFFSAKCDWADGVYSSASTPGSYSAAQMPLLGYT